MDIRCDPLRARCPVMLWPVPGRQGGAASSRPAQRREAALIPRRILANHRAACFLREARTFFSSLPMLPALGDSPRRNVGRQCQPWATAQGGDLPASYSCHCAFPYSGCAVCSVCCRSGLALLCSVVMCRSFCRFARAALAARCAASSGLLSCECLAVTSPFIAPSLPALLRELRAMRRCRFALAAR